MDLKFPGEIATPVKIFREGKEGRREGREGRRREGREEGGKKGGKEGKRKREVRKEGRTLVQPIKNSMKYTYNSKISNLCTEWLMYAKYCSEIKFLQSRSFRSKREARQNF